MPAVANRVVLGTAVAAAIAGVWLAYGPPLLIVQNEGVVVRYPWFRAAGAALVAVAGAALAASVRSVAGRVLLVLVAVFALGPTLFLARYRLEVDAESIRQREWIATRRLGWMDIRQVEPRADGIVVRAPEPPPLWIDTVGMRPADRAVLDRSIARRLTEAFAPPSSAAR
jgi:hypothetical protein